jgi:hypothetical protein
MLFSPQPGLPGSDSGAVQLREPELPFFYQLGRLPVTLLCTVKHSFGMGAATIWRSSGHWS